MVLASAVMSWVVMGWLAGGVTHRVVCRYCEARRLEVQALSAAGCGLAAICVSGPALVSGTFLVLWAVCLSVIDRHTMRLPNGLTGSGAVGVAAVSVATGRWQAAAVGAGLLAGMYVFVSVWAGLRGAGALGPGGLGPGGLSAGGFGGGDVKLAVPLGGLTAMAGGQVWFVAAVGALALTVLGAVWRALWQGGRQGPVPHGPSMCLASLITLVSLA